jgi:putative DNA primase/helicase
VVEMGIGKWGKPVTSCVVVGTDAPEKQTTCKRPSEIAGAITEVLTTRGTGMRKRELVDRFESRYHPSAVYRELKKMAEGGRVKEVVGLIALVPQ